MEMQTIEALAIDAQHLQLQTPLPNLDLIGQKVLVYILPIENGRERALRDLEIAYRTMSEAERQREIAWAEEGLRGQLPITAEFPDEEDERWWE